MMGKIRKPQDLCEQAGIPCRAFGHHADFKMISMIDSEDHFLFMADDGPLYSVGRKFITETDLADVALRALEIMAYTFHEYSARECLNGQNCSVFLLEYMVPNRSNPMIIWDRDEFYTRGFAAFCLGARQCAKSSPP
jgi:hypothetical protein